MFFKSKPLLYLHLLDKSLRYLAVDPKNQAIIEKDELVFDANILEDGKITNVSLLETRLDALVKEKKWKNAQTHLLVFNDFVTVREETVPGQLTESETRDYLSLHMNQSIRMPFENPKFAFDVIEKNENEQKIVLLAYPGELVDQYQELLQNVSLKPVVADVIPLSLYRIGEARGLIQNEEGQHTMILEWNPYDTSIMVFHEDRPTFNRHSESLRLADSWELTQDAEWVWAQTSDEMDIMLEDRLDELGRFLDFYRYSVLDGADRVSEIILTGYFPNLSMLRERLMERFDVTVHLIDLPDRIDQPFSALYGLTLKEDTGGRIG